MTISVKGESVDMPTVIKACYPLFSIAAISILMWHALDLGHNGVLLTGSLTAIAGIGGFYFGRK